MQKTIYKITKMDCPSEENLIRMKLDGYPSIVNLDFDLPNRQLGIFQHYNVESAENDDIDYALKSLNLGATKLSTKTVHQNSVQANQQKNISKNDTQKKAIT